MLSGLITSIRFDDAVLAFSFILDIGSCHASLECSLDYPQEKAKITFKEVYIT